MPHLNELQAKHANDGVTIVAVTKEDKRNSLEAVRKMVKDKADVMGYTVAWDNGDKTYKSLMTATAQGGIPTSFIVDKQGRLAFIGHPVELDEPLKKVIAGTWDIEKDNAEFAKQREIQAIARRAAYKERSELMAATQNSVQGKGAGKVQEMWKAFQKNQPERAADEILQHRVLFALGESTRLSPWHARSSPLLFLRKTTLA